MKTFLEFLNDTEEQQILDEASLLSKGFAFGQLQRTKSARQKVHAHLSKMKGIVSSIRSKGDTNEKIESLAEAFEELVNALHFQAEISVHIMNTIAANALLSDNLSTILKDIKKRGKS